MYNSKNRTFLLKNHLKSVLGSTQLNSIVVNDRQWQWLEAGDLRAKETVVLLHGLSMSRNHWHSVIPVLAKRYRVIVPDVPGLKLGFGAVSPEYGFDGLAKELSEFLQAVVGRPTHLVGHSMAATLALSLTLRMSVPVMSVSLISLADINITEDISVAHNFKYFSKFIRNMDEAQHQQYVTSMFHHPPPAIALIAKAAWVNFSQHRSEVADLLLAMENELAMVEGQLDSLNIPILVMNGKQDLWKDLTKISRFFSSVNVQRIELEECRHLPFIERPIEFCEALASFIDSTTNAERRQVS